VWVELGTLDLQFNPIPRSHPLSFNRGAFDQLVDALMVIINSCWGGEGNLRPRRPPREYLGEYTS